MIKVTLTNPPVLNKIYRIAGSRMYKTQEAKEWQEESAWIMGSNVPPFNGMVKVSIKQYPPDKRRRDTDGIEKLLFDAIEDSGLIENDYQIKKHTTERMECDKENPRLEVVIKELNEK